MSALLYRDNTSSGVETGETHDYIAAGGRLLVMD